ncbi:hypothetical protein CROQUDRAFT_261256 [Cronartium quercuum f. sp. fusiforme G11]|uniref:Uncharacterized protein n=1 Tax=Cronartium quercuum f. sp. fusiforme G11 TaxID=708437 RepID=A0A9P6TF15_9BASI|nr:hypothetical protein CROQUDRAFT_261256 [Cronartium quercuum f. sp. fusiforme G11]
MDNAQLTGTKVRGRPRKSVDPHDPTATPKRKRGRPRKDSYTAEESSGAQASKKTKKSNPIPMVGEDGKPFPPAINATLSRLDEHTLSKPLRMCVLGIVRDIIKITQGTCHKVIITIFSQGPKLIVFIRTLLLKNVTCLLDAWAHTVECEKSKSPAGVDPALLSAKKDSIKISGASIPVPVNHGSVS